MLILNCKYGRGKSYSVTITNPSSSHSQYWDYRELGIASDDLGSKILFAGIRLLLAGILVFFISKVRHTLLAYHPISTVAIYNAFIPIFGVVFSSLILGEQFMWKYLIAGILVAGGIIAVNYKKCKWECYTFFEIENWIKSNFHRKRINTNSSRSIPVK